MRKHFGSNPWFYPLPVLIIGTYDENGNADAMNAAWGGLYDRDKVVLCLSAGHKTTQNIKAKGAFTVSFADAAHVVEADYVGLVSANQEPDKLAKAGLHTTRSDTVDAPLIDEFPVALECRLLKVNEDGNIIGQIVGISADEKVLGADGKIDAAKLQAISFDPCGNTYMKMGEVWSREEQLSPRDRSMITIAALFSAGLYPQLKSHLEIGKAHGVTRQEAVEIVTQLAFYCGWPKAWSTFPLIREVYGEDDGVDPNRLSCFPVGEKNDAFAQYFIGQSYLAPLSAQQVPVFNVTFEPGCRNNWHIHHAERGGGQMLVCVSGRGWYQEWGQEPRELRPGNVVNIPAGVKHWHGAAKDSWFQHLAMEVPGEGGRTEWCEAVDENQYSILE